MQPLVLAMIGDSVQTLFVREHIAKTYGFKVNKMNKMVSSVVSAGSQFFIMTTDENISLTGYYAGFGKVVEGLDVVHATRYQKQKRRLESRLNFA